MFARVNQHKTHLPLTKKRFNNDYLDFNPAKKPDGDSP